MAETTSFVIQYLADISKVKKQLRELGKLNSNMSKNLGKDFTKAIDIVDRRIKSIRARPVFDKNLGRNVIKTFAEVETVFKGTDGKLKTMTQSTVLANGKLKVLNTTVKNGAAATRTFGQNIATLTKRALLTIPVWFALRGAIFGVFRTIRDGLKDIASFDRALQKLRRNIEATSSNVDRDFTRARKVIEEFSLKSGKSVQEITNAIQKFATVGFDFETSLEGGLRATQLAVTLFGDAEETAQAFARSLRVLTEGMDDPIEQQQAIAEALALTDQLWQTNAFEINEFSNNLEKFAGTAKIANLSIEDTLTLLATLSTAGLGQRAGRLLRSTILRSLADIENITKVLDLEFDPQKQPTIVFITELVSKLNPVELAETLADLFSVRSTEALAGLTALEETLKENLALTPDLAKFDSTMEGLLSTTGSLEEQFTNVRKALGRLFVQGLVGGKDFEESLERIVNFLRNATDDAEAFGTMINRAFQTVNKIANIPLVSVSNVPIIREMIKEMNDFSIKIKNSKSDLDNVTSSAKEFGIQLQKALSGDLNVEELERVFADIQTRLKTDTVDPGIDRTVLQKSLEAVEKQLEVEREITEEKNKQGEASAKVGIAENKRREIAEIVLQNELELLRSRGAMASQITEAEQLLRSQLNIEKTKLQQLEDQLRKEREINDERRLRSELGNESIKLFRIAQTEGVAVAKRIGDVLAGNTDFANFVRRGGKELEIFKEKFANIFEQQQAGAFFRGGTVPDIAGLRGGAGIAIEEEAIRTPVRSFNVQAQLQQRALESGLARLNVQEQTVQAQNVIINTTGGVESLRQQFQAGEAITSSSAQALVTSEVARTTRVIDLNLNINGTNFNFAGDEEAIRVLARQVTSDPNVLSTLENQIVNALDNPQSKISKGVNQRIEQF